MTGVAQVERVQALERVLGALEICLEDLGRPIEGLMPSDIEPPCQRLQRALMDAVDTFGQVRKEPDMPPEFRIRMRSAFQRVLALREALSRVTSSVDRALETLIPTQNVAPTYGRYHSQSVGRTGRFASMNA